MKQVFYTVKLEKDSCPVKYMMPSQYYVQTFSGPFSDPGEASQEFQNSVRTLDRSLECCYLDEDQFDQKMRALAKERRETARLLQAWLGQ